jgi:hypothetical protein
MPSYLHDLQRPAEANSGFQNPHMEYNKNFSKDPTEAGYSIDEHSFNREH